MLIAAFDARRLFERLGLDTLEDPIFEGDRGLVEHLAHEIGHALSLGLEIGLGINKAIDITLRRDCSPRKQIREEALVLAAEAIALPRLGVHFSESYPGQTLRDAAEVQGVPNRDYWRAFGSKAARQLGVRVLRYIGRRAGCGRRV
ncbi:hypothetical protein [uncultured Zoogloea sp.]|uniref:hypothetical protein n=1 Tax=uncultured Zoogloea sp. TaxID=160237 RepID=UPI00262E0161|nr:hypothetical protein [uncultured Zoogloea sp.]